MALNFCVQVALGVFYNRLKRQIDAMNTSGDTAIHI